MLEVVSHEYDPDRNIDTFVLNPGNMTAMIKVLDEGDEPEVLLGVAAMTYEQKSDTEPTWTTCANPEIKAIALEEFAKRNA